MAAGFSQVLIADPRITTWTLAEGVRLSLRKFRSKEQGGHHLISPKLIASYRFVPNTQERHIKFPTQDPHPQTQNRNLSISTTKEVDKNMYYTYK